MNDQRQEAHAGTPLRRSGGDPVHDERFKSDRLQKYFSVPPSAAAFMVLGTLALLSLFSTQVVGDVGVIWALVWGAACFFAALPRLNFEMSSPMSHLVDQWLREDLDRLLVDDFSEIFEKLGLIETQVQQEPWRTHGVYLETTKFIEPKVRRGADGKDRFSAHQLLVLVLTEHHLHAYSCIYDSIERRAAFVGVREYAYNDLVSVQGTNEVEYYLPPKNMPLWVRLIPGLAEYFDLVSEQKIAVPKQSICLTFVNGETIEVPIAVPDVVQRDRTAPSAPSLDQMIELLRTLYRGKKQQLGTAVA